MISPNFYKGKFLLGIYFLVNKTHKSKSLINLVKKNYIYLNVLYDIYDLSLFISDKASLPSLRVFKTSQEKKEIIRMVSAIRDISVPLKL